MANPERRPLRVIQWSTGNAGKNAVRGIVRRALQRRVAHSEIEQRGLAAIVDRDLAGVDRRGLADMRGQRLDSRAGQRAGELRLLRRRELTLQMRRADLGAAKARDLVAAIRLDGPDRSGLARKSVLRVLDSEHWFCRTIRRLRLMRWRHADGGRGEQP